MNTIKEFFIKQLVSSGKTRWKQGTKLKVAIVTNRYFTKQSWDRTLSECLGTELEIWDVVYCKQKADVYRHVPSADVCFAFSLGDYLFENLILPKMIYFPVLGLDFLKEHIIPSNIRIEQPPPFSAISIAEYCIAMSIILTRNLANAFINKAEKKWDQSNIIPASVVSIRSCRIGILGFGRVGTMIAEGYKNLGCEVIACDKVAPQKNSFLTSFFPSENIDDFIEESDILIIALPLNESTRKMIDLRRLELLGKEKYLINISRGEIVDEEALLQALSKNTIRGAAIDVFEHEPLPRNSKLYKCKNLIITPHIAGNLNLFVDEIQLDFINKTIAYSRDV